MQRFPNPSAHDPGHGHAKFTGEHIKFYHHKKGASSFHYKHVKFQAYGVRSKFTVSIKIVKNSFQTSLLGFIKVLSQIMNCPECRKKQ